MVNQKRRQFLEAAAVSGAGIALPTSVASADRGPPGDPDYNFGGGATRTHSSTWSLPEVNHQIELTIGEYDWTCDSGSGQPRTWYDVSITTSTYEGDGNSQSDFLERIVTSDLWIEWNTDELSAWSNITDSYLGAWDNYSYNYSKDYPWLDDVIAIGVSAMPGGFYYTAANIVAWTTYTIFNNYNNNTSSLERNFDFVSNGQGDRDRCSAYMLVEVEAKEHDPTMKFGGQAISDHSTRGGLFPDVEHTYTAYTPGCSNLPRTTTTSTDRHRGHFSGKEIRESPEQFNLPPVAIKDIEPDQEVELFEPDGKLKKTETDVNRKINY